MGKPAACLMRLFQGFISALMSFLRLEMHWNRFKSGHQEFTMRTGLRLRWNLWSPDNISTRSAPAFPSSFSFGFPSFFLRLHYEPFSRPVLLIKISEGMPVSSNQVEIRSSPSGGPFSSATRPNPKSVQGEPVCAVKLVAKTALSTSILIQTRRHVNIP